MNEIVRGLDFHGHRGNLVYILYSRFDMKSKCPKAIPKIRPKPSPKDEAYRDRLDETPVRVPVSWSN